MPDLSVIIPTYNEAAIISATLEQVVAWLDDNNFNYEVLVVDDGSDDASYAIVRQAASQHCCVSPLALGANYGKGFALKFGVAFARGTYVVFLDADLDIPPSQIGVLWDVMEQTGADAIIGSKRHPASEVRYPLLRRVLSLSYYLLSRLLFGLPLQDTQTGIKLFRREMLMDVLPRLLIKRFAFDLELLACANRLGYRIVEAPVVLRYNRPASRITWKEMEAMALDTLAIFYRARLLHYYDG